MTIENWCPIACNNLKRVCNKYEASLVVTSSWRHEYTLAQLKEFFSSNGIDGDLIVDTTPSYVDGPVDKDHLRGHEIEYWLEHHAPETYRYAIIDDESNILPGQEENFVHVGDRDGFADLMALNRCIEILSV